MSWEKKDTIKRAYKNCSSGAPITCPRCSRKVWFTMNDTCIWCDIEAAMVDKRKVCDELEEKRRRLGLHDDYWDNGYCCGINDAIELIAQQPVAEKPDPWPCEFGGGGR